MKYVIFLLGILMPLFLLPQSPCDLEPDAGPCAAAIVRYYYDNNSQDCQTGVSYKKKVVKKLKS